MKKGNSYALASDGVKKETIRCRLLRKFNGSKCLLTGSQTKQCEPPKQASVAATIPERVQLKNAGRKDSGEIQGHDDSELPIPCLPK